MGWASTSDPVGAYDLTFDSEDAAVRYCDANGLEWFLEELKPIEKQNQSYEDNFKYKPGGKVPDEDLW